MGYLLYLMFRCHFDVMESLDVGGFLWDLNTPGLCLDGEMWEKKSHQSL